MNWLVCKFLAVKTNILPNSAKDIDGILKLVLNILVYGIGVVAVIGVVIAGILYLAARDNEAQVATAKRRLIEISIGLVIWVAMWSLLNFLVPGGVNI